jgi:hypothetical protein
MQQTDPEAAALVDELQRRRVAGSDDLDLITYLCNRYRIAKPTARDLYDCFYHGFRDGADSNFDSTKTLEAGAARGPVYHHAFLLGRVSFQRERAKRMAGTRRAGCVGVPVLGAAVAAVVSLL